MSGVCTVPSSRMTWCATTSLFLNMTSCPGDTLAGLGENASLPPCPVIVMVTVDDPPPVGAVGVLLPPPPPPQLHATKAPVTASATAVPAFLIDLPPEWDPIGIRDGKRRTLPEHADLFGISATFAAGVTWAVKRLTGGGVGVGPGARARRFSARNRSC